MSFLIIVTCVGGLAVVGAYAGFAVALATAPMDSEGLPVMAGMVTVGAIIGGVVGSGLAARLM